MVPISLRLSNFLSYGTNNEPLQFDQFDVACLSGVNGAGKSALLDAMTWALWRKARQGRTQGNPDDELLRIGAREMSVEFCFQIEDKQYRIYRFFRLSATGKTPTPNLEFQVLDNVSGEYRPLTTKSITDTQALIEQTVGIDYETFINSAFLLQGRSNLFASKKPTERKEILSKILNLDKYQQLEEKAKEKIRQATQSLSIAQMQIENIEKILENEPGWKAEKKSLEELYESENRVANTSKEHLISLQKKLAQLEGKVAQKKQYETQIQQIVETLTQNQSRLAELEAQISEANALIAQSDAIHEAYQSWEALQSQRDLLDDSATIHREFEKQLEQKKHQLEREKRELENRLKEFRREEENTKTQLQDIERKLKEEPNIRQELTQIQQAKPALEKLEALKQNRERWEKEKQVLAQERLAQKVALESKESQLKTEIQKVTKELAILPQLKAQIKQLEENEHRFATLKNNLEVLMQEGQEKGNQEASEQQKKVLYEKEIQKLELLVQRVSGTTEKACPTCGTPLTETHKQSVLATYRVELESLHKSKRSSEKKLEEIAQALNIKRQEYKSLKALVEKGIDNTKKLTEARQIIQSLEQAKKELQEKEQALHDIQKMLHENKFSLALDQQIATIAQKLNDNSFDSQQYVTLQSKVLNERHFERLIQDIVLEKGRAESLQKKSASLSTNIQELSVALDTGKPFEKIKGEIQKTVQKIAKLGYEPSRHQEVKQALSTLSDVPKKLTELNRAYKTIESDTASKTETIAFIAKQHAQIEKTKEKIQTLETEITGVAQLQEEINTQEKHFLQQQTALQERAQQIGAIDIQLATCKAKRKELAEISQANKNALEQKQLYTHLKNAFGKNGIPSLIIEDTIPMLEARANRLLYDLSDGKTSLQLETTRDLKKGGTASTLEINVLDEQGQPRALETYSGGEAFRVNFALRIALSQLLAERSGVQIRTLVIDEGFGTQDKEGIQNMIEAINTIRKEFDKILVITHLDGLKQAFPTRIEVIKTHAGSQFEVYNN